MIIQQAIERLKEMYNLRSPFMHGRRKEIEIAIKALEKEIPKKPIIEKSKRPTLPGELGYLNHYHCANCFKHLFGAYDKDLANGYPHISTEWKYCIKCGIAIDLTEFQKVDANENIIWEDE